MATATDADDAASSDELLTQIARLTERTRHARDRVAERRLLRLRRRAGSLLTKEHDQLVDFPAADFNDLLDANALPEVRSDALNPSILRAAILRAGCLIVRDLVDRDVASNFAAEVEVAFDQRARIAAGELAESGYYEEFQFEAPYKSPPRLWIKEGGGLLAVDSPRLAFDLFEMFEHSGALDIVTGYLGPAVLSAEKTTLRKVVPATSGAWHQDGAFMGDVRSLNIWLSLSHCGDDAPGLDIVPRRLDALVPTGTEGAFLPDQVSPLKVTEVAGDDAIVRPIFEPGDAVLFDDLCLHQTAADPSMPNTRYAIESWFFAAAGLATMYAPIAI